MTLYFSDTSKWEVRAVEGTPWPGYDAEGNRCYENTHFKTEQEAIDNLFIQAKAWVVLKGRDVEQARMKLRAQEREAADAAAMLSKLTDRYPR